MTEKINNIRDNDTVFIDANIFLYHAFGLNDIAVDFLRKIETNRIRAFTSSLVLEEVFYKLIMQSASVFLDKVTIENVEAAIKDDRYKEKIFKPVHEYRQYIEMLIELGLKVIDLTGSDVIKAIEKSEKLGLLTADTTHISVMERKGIKNLASADKDFVGIPHITIWSPIDE